MVKKGGFMKANSSHQKSLDETGFWGNRGAGCLVLAESTGRVLFAKRSAEVLEPHTWGTWGGAVDPKESPREAALREFFEETGYEGPAPALIRLFTYKHESGFRYYNYLAVVKEEFIPVLDKETEDFRWVEIGDWPSPLHPGAAVLLESISLLV
jgi:8-oxo-dGTP pyrophosphatase MutT (NUDIX family)